MFVFHVDVCRPGVVGCVCLVGWLVVFVFHVDVCRAGLVGCGTSEKKLLAGRSIRPSMMDRPDQINDWTKALHPSDGTRPPTPKKSVLFCFFFRFFVFYPTFVTASDYHS